MDREERVREWVEFLCSRECAGRAPGTPQGEAARARIVAELRQAGLEPAGSEGYLQPVPGCGGANVLARIPGDGELAERAILIAAHYDHLGQASGDEAFWGADDNAAAVAILLDLSLRLAGSRVDGRQVLICFFDGEEPPYYLSDAMGSVHYVGQQTFPLERIDMMVCMDLVGHAVGPPEFPEDIRQSLFVLGAELSQGTGSLVDGLQENVAGVRTRRLASEVIPPLSDYYAFQEAGIPFLFLTCGRWEHYHQITDTPDRLDYPKIVATADYLAKLTSALRARPEHQVVFEREGRDDAATIRTLIDMARLLAPVVPQASMALPMLEPLLEKARRQPLSGEEQAMLPLLVAQLENLVA